jgi:hypothetical protein
MQISARGMVATIAESAGQNGNKIFFILLINININCSKVGTVFLFIYYLTSTSGK